MKAIKKTLTQKKKETRKVRQKNKQTFRNTTE